jgi:site-specific recombinase XerD
MFLLWRRSSFVTPSEAERLPITRAVERWLVDLQQRRDPDTVRAYTSVLNDWLAWLAHDHPHVHQIDDLQLRILKDYVNRLKQRTDKRKLLARQRDDVGNTLPAPAHGRVTGDDQTLLADSTRLMYVDVVCRFIAWLIDTGKLPGLPADGERYTAAAVREALERMLPRRKASQAPRMPDLRRLPGIYPLHLVRFTQQHTADIFNPRAVAVHRTYLNLLRNQALVAVLFSTGGRISEVLGLNVAPLLRSGVSRIDELTADAIQDHITVTGKGGRQRVVYFNRVARSFIATYLRVRSVWFPESADVFISHGPVGKGERITVVTAWRIVKTAVDALIAIRTGEGASAEELQALANVTPHSVRHFFAQGMLDEGANYQDIAAALGHSSTVVTEQVYARMSDDAVLEVVDQFAPRPDLSDSLPDA